ATAALPAIMVARAGLRTGRAVATSGAGTAVVAGRYVRERRADHRDHERHQETHARYEEHTADHVATRAEAAEAANNRLNERANQTLNARYTEALATIRAAPGGLAGTGPGEVHARDDEPHRHDEKLQAARRLIADADEHERETGRRWTGGQRADARAAIEQEAQSEPADRDYESLAYRLGKDGRERYNRTKPESPERAALEAQIDAQLERDREDVATVRQGTLPVPRQASPRVRPQLPRPRRFRQPGEYPGVPRAPRNLPTEEAEEAEETPVLQAE
ncbi:MAG: hypothetical protein FWD04_10315, partial [Conexibacteraceae bacterium]|nr:hypothetical protein [Conexibacteraceae bacterium]